MITSKKSPELFKTYIQLCVKMTAEVLSDLNPVWNMIHKNAIIYTCFMKFRFRKLPDIMTWRWIGITDNLDVGKYFSCILISMSYFFKF